MDESEIKSKLNTLSEYQAHRDLLDADKRNLLSEVTVPAEVEAVVSAGMKKMGEVEQQFRPELDDLAIETRIKLDAIVVPEEIKVALAEIDRKRAEAKAALDEKQNEIVARIRAAKAEIQASTEAQTRDVYAALAKRKAEIEAEFSGKTEAAEANIAALEKEIKDAVKSLKFTVKGDHLRAEFTKGKKSWIPQRLDAYTETHPDIKECYTVGDPSVAIKRI